MGRDRGGEDVDLVGQGRRDERLARLVDPDRARRDIRRDRERINAPLQGIGIKARLVHTVVTQPEPGKQDGGTVARKHDFAYNRVTIRQQKTRWGSCSSQGTICLNWRLLLLPSDLCDYVLVHELCHLRHLDHSAKFWSLVESVFPDYEERERRLESLQGTLAL